VVTGSASGIGRATSELLIERGNRVTGVDIHDADVVVDLSTHEGRMDPVSKATELTGGEIDAIIANAGLATATATTVAVNCYGAAATASMASLFPPDEQLSSDLLAGDEPASLLRGRVLEANPDLSSQICGTTKQALSKWIRRSAAEPAWAGAGIPLNAVAPGCLRCRRDANDSKLTRFRRSAPG